MCLYGQYVLKHYSEFPFGTEHHLCQSRVEIEANVRNDEKRIFAQRGRTGFFPSTSAPG